jgi:HEAT repeat protein
MALKKSTMTTAAAADIRHYARDLPGLLDQLQDPQASVRRWAARDLALHPEAAVALCRRLEAELDNPTREAIAVALIAIGGGTVVTELLPLLRSDDPALRNFVIDILKELPTEVAPQMEALLAAPDTDARIFTVNVLETLRHPKVEEWLIAVVVADPHVNVVGAALNVLCEIGTEAALPALASVVQRFAGEDFIAFAAGHAVIRIESTRS